MENKDKKNTNLSDGEIIKFTTHERYIWDHLVNSIPDDLELLPHYYSPLTNYEKKIDFNEGINIEKLEIPLHIYLKNNTFHHPIVDEFNTIMEKKDIILKPLNEDDFEKFKKVKGVNVQFDKESGWDYYLNYSFDDFNVEPGFAALLFTYKGFSMAAISIHPGGNIDVRGPYMVSKVYLLKHGNIFDYSSIKGFVLGTNIVLDTMQIKEYFYYNEPLNIWQHQKSNIPIMVTVSEKPSNINLEDDKIPEVLK